MDSKYKECIPYLLAGVRSGAIGADDSKFYFHLGDAYSRLHQNTKVIENIKMYFCLSFSVISAKLHLDFLGMGNISGSCYKENLSVR